MPFRIDCPHCEKRLRVPVRLAGKEAPCPVCTTRLSFPAIAKAKLVQPEETALPTIEVVESKPEQPFLVVDRPSVSSRIPREKSFVLPGISLMVLCFAAGLLYGQYRALEQFRHLLPPGTKVQLLPSLIGNNPEAKRTGPQARPAEAQKAQIKGLPAEQPT